MKMRCFSPGSRRAGKGREGKTAKAAKCPILFLYALCVLSYIALREKEKLFSSQKPQRIYAKAAKNFYSSLCALRLIFAHFA